MSVPAPDAPQAAVPGGMSGAVPPPAAAPARSWLASWKFWTVMAVLAGLVGLFTFGFTQDPKLVRSPLVGKMAPPFVLDRLNGPGHINLADLKGTPVILNFWASWCVACRDEAAVLEAAHVKYDQGQHRVRVIGIAIQDTPDKALAFAQHFGKTYPLALDSAQGDVGLSYGLYGVPETFFISANGTILYKQIGGVTEDIIREQVNQLAPAKGGS